MAIEGLVPRPRKVRPPLNGLDAVAKRVAQVYRRARPAGRPGSAPWLAALSDVQRAEFRERGQQLLAVLLQHLNEEGRREAGNLAEATSAAAEYGHRAAALGASPSETVEALVRFREALIGELAVIALRRRLDTREATVLLVEAESAVNQLLMALMNGHAGRA